MIITLSNLGQKPSESRDDTIGKLLNILIIIASLKLTLNIVIMVCGFPEHQFSHNDIVTCYDQLKADLGLYP